MLNKAIKTMETLRKAEETRAALTNEALETLEVLGYESAPGQTRIVINKGHIVEVQTVKEIQVTNEEELDRVYEENARHIRRINELAADNEKLIDENIELEGQIAFKDGQIFSLENTIKELEAKIAELTNDKLDDIVKKHVEGGDAMEQPKTQTKKTTNKLAGLKSMKKDFSLKEANEELKAQEQTKEEPAVKINWTQDVFDKKVNDFSCMMMGVHGDITINDKSYKFKARREFHLPIIYSFDEEVVRIAKEEINKIDRFKLSTERTANDINSKYAKDKEYPIKVWKLTEENGHIAYHGFTKDKANKLVALTWAPDKMDNKNCIGRALVSNLFTDKENWKSLRDNKVLADKFMAVCADIWPEDFTKEVPQDTNEIVVDCTNDPTAGCDDLDI